MINAADLPTPADKIISAFMNKLFPLPPGFIEGIYLTGSISLNDFHANKSDIDFLVLCKELPDKNTTAKLVTIHKSLEKEFSITKLNGAYIGTASLKTDHPAKTGSLSYHNGRLKWADFEMGIVTLSELRTNAITLFGKNAQSLPITVRSKQLKDFLHENINSYWRNWVKRHANNLNKGCILMIVPGLTEWSVLGVARQLCTLKTGEIFSKTEAGNLCLNYLSESCHSIIKEAIDIRKDNRVHPLLRSHRISPSLRRQRETVNCVNHIIGEFNKIYAT